MYNGVKVLDVHGHVTSPEATRAYFNQMETTNTPLPSPLSSGGILGPSGRPGSGLSAEDFRASAQWHVDYMDVRNIDVQVIGPRPVRMMGSMEEHLFPHWTAFVNDCIYVQCQEFPDRFAGAAQLPQNAYAPDAAHMLTELDRCVNELGFIATYVSPDPTGRRDSPGLHAPYWYPLYEYCQKNNLPILVHGTNALDPRYRVVPQNYQLGFYTEQYLATQFLGHSDVFERYPELKVVVCHCGGGLDRFAPTDPHLPQKNLVNNLLFDTCAYDPIFLEAAIKQRGVERILFGSEAPGSGSHTPPGSTRSTDDLVPVIDAFGFLAHDDKLKIFNRNPKKIFKALAKWDSAPVALAGVA
jgi:predicted TIM-barrel fold metal-dependent hydrolase